MEQPFVPQEPPPQFTWKRKATWFSIDESTLCLRNSSDVSSSSMEIPSQYILSANTVEESGKNESKVTLKIDFIKSKGEKSLKKSTIQMIGSKENCESGASHINGLVQSLPNRKKSLLMIVNPVSGRKKGLTIYNKILPLFELAKIKTELVVSKEKGYITEFLKHKDLDNIDGVVLVGGDGTYYEVLNGLLYRAQADAKYDLDCPGCDWMPSPLPVGIIPCGTGNGIAKALVSLDPVTAALAIIIGKQCEMTTYTVHQGSGKFLTFGGLLIGYGYFSDVIYKSENRRSLGIFRYPVYLLWGLFHIRRFKVDIEYEVPMETLTAQSEVGASTVQQNESGASPVQDGGDDCASDVNVGSKPENSSVTSPNKEPLQSEVKATIEGESNLEVKGEEFVSSESNPADENMKVLNNESKTGDQDKEAVVQSGGLAERPKGPVTDGVVPDDNLSKGSLATKDTDVADTAQGAVAAVPCSSRKDWKYTTGTYMSFGTFLHYDFNEPKTGAVDIFLCNSFGDMKNMFKRVLNLTKEYPGTVLKTWRLLLEIPAVNENIEMEMALNCDGDYIILEAPIFLQICFQVGLINLFCC